MTAETSKLSQTGRNKSISRQLSLSSCAQQTPEPACRVTVGDVGDESLFFLLDSRADGVLTAVTTVMNAWDGIDPGGLGGCVCRRRRRRRLGLLARKRKGKGEPGRGRGRGGRVPNPDARRAGEPASQRVGLTVGLGVGGTVDGWVDGWRGKRKGGCWGVSLQEPREEQVVVAVREGRRRGGRGDRIPGTWCGLCLTG